MVNPIGAANNAADIARTAANAADGARHLVRSSTQAGVLNTDLLAKDLAKVVAHDPARAAELLAEIKPSLSAADQQRLTVDLAQELDAQVATRLDLQAAQRVDDIAAQKRELALDLVQIGLSIAGIFDPTPISDGADGLISLLRGDFLGAGISVVSMIPYLGDVAKLGKLPKFAQTIARAVDLAKLDPGFARVIEPALSKIRDALRAVPTDSLPAPAREAIESMRAKLDEFATGTPPTRSYDTTVRGQRVTLDGIEVRSVDYVKRDRATYDQLRRDFDNSGRSNFLKSLANDPQKVQALRQAGLDDAAIARIADGKVPSGYQVHHKLPLDDGGTNSFDNLVLIKNDPYHIGITNAQSTLVGDLQVGQSARVDWPVVPGFIYPPQ